MAKYHVSYRALVSGCGIRNYCGALAQLVARFNGIEEVRGSNPLRSTIFFSDLFLSMGNPCPLPAEHKLLC